MLTKLLDWKRSLDTFFPNSNEFARVSCVVADFNVASYKRRSAEGGLVPQNPGSNLFSVISV